MNTCRLLLIIVSFIVAGCATTPHKPKTFSTKPGIAFRALDIESAEWDRCAARQSLSNLVRITSEAVRTSRTEMDSPRILEVIHRAIQKAGFCIGQKSGKTFGNALADKKFDCSDLSLVYLEVLQSFGVEVKPVFGRDHVLIAVTSKKGSLYWETTSGKEVTREQVLRKIRYNPKIYCGVYLVPLPPEMLLSAVYTEMALQMQGEQEKDSRAEEIFLKALEVNGDLVSGLQSYAAYLFKHKRFTEAEPVLQSAIRRDPKSPRLYDFAAELYECDGEMQKALEMCNLAFENYTINDSTLDRYVRLSIDKIEATGSR
jgi:hypothetical protein